ncbi:hypothetical protein [Paenibacillus sp. FSL R5-0912]|uniref:hypothetical protein n=1 Tax=Paenibacillus sp. FSL R5-0912 TaxID=1536771 RepID=UPI0004F6E79F|nr:hypothetical protein [Paenibacillus sp. FSL R5-0912]AIQ40511.1 hypothetical protein R50912_11120 [Paenibacillus sp. FSL R5-0912]
MLSFALIIISLFLYGLESNIFKDASGDVLSIYDSIVYYPLHSILYIVLGLPFLTTSIPLIVTDWRFGLLIVTETLNSLGILWLLRDTNATVSVAILGTANISAALFIDHSVWVFVLINVVCLGVYLYQSKNSLSRIGWFSSLVLIFIPAAISAKLLTVFTESVGNAMAVFGMATLVPSLLAFLIFMRRIRFKNAKPFVRSAAISAVAGFICFYAFSIATSPAAALIALSFECVMTEISAYIFKDQSNLYLGRKSKLQMTSLLVISLSATLSVLLHT